MAAICGCSTLIRHRFRLHVFERIESLAGASQKNLIDQRRSSRFTQRFHKRIAYEFGVGHANRGLRLGIGDEGVDDVGSLVPRDIGDLRHRRTDLLHELGRQVLENRRSLPLAERQQQDGGAVDTRPRFT